MRVEYKSVSTNLNSINNFYRIIGSLPEIYRPYESRNIYSIYYDTDNYELAIQSLVGQSNRYKLRYRFYSNYELDLEDFPNFKKFNGSYEVKIKQGIYNNKITTNSEYSEDLNSLAEKLNNNNLSINKNLVPKILIGYKRNYFQSSVNSVRLTIDSNISVFKLDYNKKFKFLEKNFNLQILEIKINKDFFNNNQLNLGFNFTKTKFSKYLYGLSRASLISYIF